MGGNVLEAMKSAPQGQAFEPKEWKPRNHGVPSPRRYNLRLPISK